MDRRATSSRLRCIGFIVVAFLGLLSCRTVEPARSPGESSAARSDTITAQEPEPIQAGVAPPLGAYAPGFDALHYDVALVLPDTGSFVEGTATLRIRLEQPRRDTLELDFSGLAVEGVRLGSMPVTYRHDKGRLLIPVVEAGSAGDTIVVEIAYSGRPDDGLILARNIHGRPTAFADNWPNRARFWFPSIDHPSDKATAQFSVRSNDSRQVIGNGALIDDRDPAWSTWAVSEPIPTYTMVIGVAEFVVKEVGTVCSDEAGQPCTEVTMWLFPPDTAAAASSFRRAADMVAYYNELIAPFPYEKLAHVQASTRFGGMENVTAIFYPEQALAAGHDIEVTVAHETAHQWFGDAVTESDWHHLWLSEGFATYFAALFFEEADGVERFRELMEEERLGYVASDAPESPMVESEQENLFALLNANNYNKGAWVLHMLRVMLGDEAFFDGIRNYYRAHEHGTALTDDLRRALEASSGRDLSGFFDRWVFEPGYPQFEVEWSWAGGTAEVRVEQVQPWPAFEMPLVVEFTTAEASVRRRIEFAGRTTTARVDVPQEPTSFVVDPDGDMLKAVVRVERSGR